MTTWCGRPVVDAWDEDGRRALFVDDRVVVVSELAVTILDALPAAEPVIAEALVARHGRPPGDVRALVHEKLQELAEWGLVRPAEEADARPGR